jgi:hypothetical protein
VASLVERGHTEAARIASARPSGPSGSSRRAALRRFLHIFISSVRRPAPRRARRAQPARARGGSRDSRPPALR